MGAIIKWTRGLFKDDHIRGLLSKESYETAQPKIDGNWDPTLEDAIDIAITCPDCISELPDGRAMIEADNLKVGFTNDGLQVWCKTHNRNVVRIIR